MTVGYHADASSLAPKGWLTGSEWDWERPLHRHREDGARRRLHRQQVQRQLPGRLQDRREPVRPVEVRPVGRPTRPRREVEAAKAAISSEDGSPFTGPVIAQDGSVLVAAGVVPDYATIEGRSPSS